MPISGRRHISIRSVKATIRGKLERYLKVQWLTVGCVHRDEWNMNIFKRKKGATVMVTPLSILCRFKRLKTATHICAAAER